MAEAATSKVSSNSNSSTFYAGYNDVERRIQLEYQTWKEEAPLLYDTLMTSILQWPSLSVECFPGSSDVNENDNTELKVLLGTHSSSRDTNFVKIYNMEVPTENSIVNGDAYDSINKECGGILSDSCQIKEEKTIIHDGEVNRARYMPQNNNMIATKTPTSDVLLFDLSRFPDTPGPNDVCDPDVVLKGHTMEGYGLAWNTVNAGWLISSADDCRICMWDVNARIENSAKWMSSLCTYTGHQAIVEDVAWHKRNGFVFGSVDDAGMFMVWDTRTPQKTAHQVVQSHHSEINCLDFNPFDGTLVCLGSSDSSVSIYDLRSLKCPIHELRGQEEDVFQVKWSPFVRCMLASSTANGRLHVWDLGNIGKTISDYHDEDGPPELMFIHAGHTAKISDFAWSQDDPLSICSVAEDSVIQYWQMAKYQIERGTDD